MDSYKCTQEEMDKVMEECKTREIVSTFHKCITGLLEAHDPYFVLSVIEEYVSQLRQQT